MRLTAPARMASRSSVSRCFDIPVYRSLTDFSFDDSDGRRAEFVAGFKNRAWHNNKGKREYGIIKIFVFHRFFRDGVCPAGAISKTTPIDQ
jgi:hypothetical protein